MLEAVAQLIPELYAFCKNVYSSQSIIMFGTSEVFSASGAQQGDPLGPHLFCITLQPILERLQSDLKIAFLDDVTVGGLASVVQTDVNFIRREARNIGLELNDFNCEVIGDGTACHTRDALAGFMEVAKDEAMLLGSPLMQGKQLDIVLQSKCTELFVSTASHQGTLCSDNH